MSESETIYVETQSSQNLPAVADDFPANHVTSSQSAKSATQTVLVDPGEDYPVNALGDVLGSVAREIHEGVQCPKGIAGQSSLAAGALAAQGHYNIEIDGRIRPLSLNCLTIAESGERKSTADEIALSPVLEVQKEWLKQFTEDKQGFELDMEVYKHSKSEIMKNGGDQESLRADTRNLLVPEQPREPILLSQEPTLEGLLKSFHFGLRSQGLFSDEGGMFFGGFGMKPEHVLKTISGFSKFWDGSPINRTRAGQGESFMLDGVRLSSHLMIQPVIAGLLHNNPLFSEQGYLARFLMVNAAPLAGTRLYRPSNPRDSVAFTRYKEVMQRLLLTGINSNPDAELGTLGLDKQAMELWIETYNSIERELGKGCDLVAIKPTASKMAENIARIAGILAVFDEVTAIGVQHMGNAAILGSYYLDQAQAFTYSVKVDAKLDKALELEEWIRKLPRKVFSADDVSKTPRRITDRSVPFARGLLEVLVFNGRLTVTKHNTLGKPCEWTVYSDV